jgi:hypothetical protein
VKCSHQYEKKEKRLNREGGDLTPICVCCELSRHIGVNALAKGVHIAVQHKRYETVIDNVRDVAIFICIVFWQSALLSTVTGTVLRVRGKPVVKPADVLHTAYVTLIGLHGRQLLPESLCE